MIHPLIPYIHLLLANDLEQRTYMHLVELVTLIIYKILKDDEKEFV